MCQAQEIGPFGIVAQDSLHADAFILRRYDQCAKTVFVNNGLDFLDSRFRIRGSARIGKSQPAQAQQKKKGQGQPLRRQGAQPLPKRFANAVGAYRSPFFQQYHRITEIHDRLFALRLHRFRAFLHRTPLLQAGRDLTPCVRRLAGLRPCHAGQAQKKRRTRGDVRTVGRQGSAIEQYLAVERRHPHGRGAVPGKAYDDVRVPGSD